MRKCCLSYKGEKRISVIPWTENLETCINVLRNASNWKCRLYINEILVLTLSTATISWLIDWIRQTFDGSRFLNVQLVKQTTVVLMKMSGNSWPFSSFCEQRGSHFMLHVTRVCRQQGKVKLKGGCCLAWKLEVRSPTFYITKTRRIQINPILVLLQELVICSVTTKFHKVRSDKISSHSLGKCLITDSACFQLIHV